MSYCDLPPKFFSARWPKARKEHSCVECGQTIRKGEVYGKFSGLWDDRFDTYKQHLECEDACVYIRDMQGECLCFGELFENYIDWVHQKRGHPLRSLMAAAEWRRRKGRPLTLFKIKKPETYSFQWLNEHREKGFA